MYKINEDIKIQINRTIDSNFDNACEEAYELACAKFGLDEYGYCENIEDWNRKIDRIVIEFNNYCHIGSMAGQKHIYTFTARADRNDEDM